MWALAPKSAQSVLVYSSPRNEPSLVVKHIGGSPTLRVCISRSSMRTTGRRSHSHVVTTHIRWGLRSFSGPRDCHMSSLRSLNMVSDFVYFLAPSLDSWVRAIASSPAGVEASCLLLPYSLTLKLHTLGWGY